MKRIFYIGMVMLAFSSLLSCTTARWTVKEEAATDTTDYKILDQHYFLNQSKKITPDDPVLKLDYLVQTTYQYSQKVLMQRSVQRYHLRPGFFALALSGAATAFYAGNSSSLKGNASIKSLIFNVAGVALAVAGVFNMKPVGEPRPTGEERYLRTTDKVIQIDTSRVQQKSSEQASVMVTYKDRIVFEEQNRTLSAGKLQIPLANKLTDLHIQGLQPGAIDVKVEFTDSTYQYRYPIDDILAPYALVTSRFTELRKTPGEDPDEVLADLVEGSQIRIQSMEDEEWYRVQYGVSENYILKSDADLVWRASGFVQENQVVTIPRVPFGNIDVESNIPVLRGYSPNAYALIVSNEDYGSALPPKRYARRDGRLIEQYLINALGFPQQQIFMLDDIPSPSELNNALSKIKKNASDSTQLFIYFSGYGAVNKSGEEVSRLTFLPTDSTKKIDLRRQFKNIAAIPSTQTVVASNIDFSRFGGEKLTAKQGQQIIESYAKILRSTSGQTSLLTGSNLNQPNSIFANDSGVDKNHHIFPYFFMQALQKKKTSLSAINEYLQRNVSYTTRKLYDHPQDPILSGDEAIDLTRP